MSALTRIAAFLAAAALSPAALAAEASMDKADVVWMLVSTTLVLFMTIPGIALFYGGMARKKNVLSILAQTTVICCALTLVWFAAGYSLAFGPGSAFVGGLSHVFLNGLDINSMSGSIPTLLFVCFQMTFAILTATLMIGAFAGRMKFSAMLIFMILWSLCVYSPVCHWVWAEGGFFFDMGALDYAGGTVVHINAGVSDLVACLVLGKRLGYGREPMSPHNLTFAMLGAAILWIGWFGFNGGSGLAANERAVMAILVTQIAAAAAGVSWMLVEWMLRGRPSLLGLISGAVGGLVVITPAAGFVEPWAAVVMGLVVSPVCYFAVSFLKRKLGYDDALDAFGIHAIGGVTGGVLTGLFCVPELSWTDFGGLFYTGDPALLGAQVLGILVTVVFVGVLDVVLGFVVKACFKGSLRVSEAEEAQGLDVAAHGESAYPAYVGLD